MFSLQALASLLQKHRPCWAVGKCFLTAHQFDKANKTPEKQQPRVQVLSGQHTLNYGAPGKLTPERIDEAFVRAWAVLKRRAGHPKALQDRLLGIIMTYGPRHPTATPEELASAVLKMFNAYSDDGQESGPVSD